MTSSKQAHLDNAAVIQGELTALLDGMDYCLDWKPDPESWSAREVLYHLLDTPPGGIHKVAGGIAAGSITEYEIWSDRSNMTPERAAHDLEQIQQDIQHFFDSLAQALSAANDEDLEGKSALMHQRTRDEHGTQTLGDVLAGFDRHWRGHLEQLGELRDALGL